MMRFTEYLIEQPDTGPPLQRAPKPHLKGMFGKGEGVKLAPKQPAMADAAWENIKKMATDANAGREMITLLGAMYQAKRRNPVVQLTIPKMVSTLPGNTPEEKTLKDRMAQLFNLAKNDDVAHLAARIQDLQKTRMGSVSQPGTKVQPGQASMAAGQTANAPGGKVSKQQRQTLVQQLMKTIKDTAPSLTTREVKAASRELNASSKAKRIKNKRTLVPGSSAEVPTKGQPKQGVITTG